MVEGEQTHIYENLKPNTKYSFTVWAYTSHASGPSEKVFFTTGEDGALLWKSVSSSRRGVSVRPQRPSSAIFYFPSPGIFF